VNDWVLSHAANAGKTSQLVAERDFERIGFVVDVRLKDESSNALIGVGEQLTVDLRDAEVAKHLQKTGQWNRLEFTEVDGQRVLMVNGKATELSLGAISGKLSLTASGGVDFCNVYGRTIPAP